MKGCNSQFYWAVDVADVDEKEVDGCSVDFVRIATHRELLCQFALGLAASGRPLSNTVLSLYLKALIREKRKKGVSEDKMLDAVDDIKAMQSKRKDRNYELTIVKANLILLIQVPTDVKGALALAQVETHVAAGPEMEMLICRRIDELWVSSAFFLDRCFSRGRVRRARRPRHIGMRRHRSHVATRPS